ncbi:ring-cleaving dioxygenase [soil metagenome]
MSGILGLHHVTAICDDAQTNVDFYAGLLGLRVIKVTVNFDDPTTYHLYYGDGAGSPGTSMTFFPYAGSRGGRSGVGQVVVTSFSIPESSEAYWRERLAEHAIPGEGPIDFSDPDGLLLRLVPDPAYHLSAPWEGSDVPIEHQIAGFHSVTLQEREIEATAALLIRVMGYEHDEEHPADEFIFGLPDGKMGSRLDVSLQGGSVGRPGAGTIHHVAFRVTDDETQLRFRSELEAVGAQVSEVRDRDYFHSIYFREPGGVLFEIATDGPGFDADEPLDAIGKSLKLPAMHEPQRELIEATLPKLRLPGGRQIP